MNIHLDSVGCKLNQSEIERFGNRFRLAGHRLVAAAEDSDMVVINTCTVTTSAAADSRSKTRRAHRDNPKAQIVLTGCWSTLAPSHASVMPGVKMVIDNQHKDRLVEMVLGLDEEYFDREPLEREPIPGIRMRTRAFIKAQDGCDNHCTFCLIKVARGASRSIPIMRIISEIESAVKGGAQEAVLTGVQLTGYGRDLQPTIDLRHLVIQILSLSSISRLRLSSLEPWLLPPNFFDLWDDRRMCRHLHLPLQSGSAATLRRMARPITPERYAALLDEARKRIPGLAVTTDIIVGFPGETEAEFDESLTYIQKMNFAGAHVFPYSARKGTAAALLTNKVPQQVARERSRRVREAIEKSSEVYLNQFLGKTLNALWESATAIGVNGWEVKGLTDNYLRVQATVPQNIWNRITPIRVLAADKGVLHGQLV